MGFCIFLEYSVENIDLIHAGGVVLKLGLCDPGFHSLAHLGVFDVFAAACYMFAIKLLGTRIVA